MDSGYSPQLDHLIIFFIYNTDYFSELFISFELFFKQKIGSKNFVCLSENRKYIKLLSCAKNIGKIVQGK